MKLFTQNQYDTLIKNGSPENQDKDHIPVVKLFLPSSGFAWLLTELSPEQPTLAFGLCDLSMGFPELGYVDLDEITVVKNKLGLGVEQDMHFTAQYPISVYAKAAYDHQGIVESEEILKKYLPHKNDKYSL